MVAALWQRRRLASGGGGLGGVGAGTEGCFGAACSTFARHRGGGGASGVDWCYQGLVLPKNCALSRDYGRIGGELGFVEAGQRGSFGAVTGPFAAMGGIFEGPGALETSPGLL